MATKITESLFGISIEDLEEENKRQRQQVFDRLKTLKGYESLGASIGTGLGLGLRKLLGIQDPKMQRASQIRQIMTEVNKDMMGAEPAAIYSKLSERFAQAGLGDEALIASERENKLLQEQEALNLSREDKEQRRQILQQNADYKREQEEDRQASLKYRLREGTNNNIARQLADPQSPEQLTIMNYAKQFAKQHGIEDSSQVALAYNRLYLDYLRSIGVDKKGRNIYLFDPSEAKLRTEQTLNNMLEQEGAIDRGTKWNPFDETSINVDLGGVVARDAEQKQYQFTPEMRPQVQQETSPKSSFKDGEIRTKTAADGTELTYQYSAETGLWTQQ